MPRKDLIHNNDPYFIKFGTERLYVDLAAELPLAAEREGRKIAVEIKSFLNRSPLTDIQDALGQYNLYISLLEITDAERKLYLAVSKNVYDELAQSPTFQLVQTRWRLALIIVRIDEEKIEAWIE